jgi:hypothetical protein
MIFDTLLILEMELYPGYSGYVTQAQTQPSVVDNGMYFGCISMPFHVPAHESVCFNVVCL